MSCEIELYSRAGGRVFLALAICETTFFLEGRRGGGGEYSVFVLWHKVACTDEVLDIGIALGRVEVLSRLLLPVTVEAALTLRRVGVLFRPS